MKRLIVCCDGTWNKPENQNVTNIEKIARTVEIHSDRTGGCQQLVFYLSGVGTHWYWFDRVLGGAFGFGLFGNVSAGYRFLALNYEAGDEIFVFGFSRGAYTARSLVGMIGKVGLLTRDSLIRGKLTEAVDRYRNKSSADGTDFGESNKNFKDANCHQEAKIDFLGVFDTVGALGVPGALGRKHRFHDVKLSNDVLWARHALAIDERRIKFEPSLWELPKDAHKSHEAPDRVRQVWFEGVHSDVGGGFGETGLSDTALSWMAREATARGLVFDEARLAHYIESGSSAIRHDSLTPFYRLLNVFGRFRNWCVKSNPRFRGDRRVLDADGAYGMRLASSAASHWASRESYEAANIGWIAEKQENGDLAPIIEPVDTLPGPGGELGSTETATPVHA